MLLKIINDSQASSKGPVGPPASLTISTVASPHLPKCVFTASFSNYISPMEKHLYIILSALLFYLHCSQSVSVLAGAGKRCWGLYFSLTSGAAPGDVQGANFNLASGRNFPMVRGRWDWKPGLVRWASGIQIPLLSARTLIEIFRGGGGQKSVSSRGIIPQEAGGALVVGTLLLL